MLAAALASLDKSLYAFLGFDMYDPSGCMAAWLKKAGVAYDLRVVDGAVEEKTNTFSPLRGIQVHVPQKKISDAAQAAAISLCDATQAALNYQHKDRCALVTAPLAKESFEIIARNESSPLKKHAQRAKGHTEFLASAFKVPEALMLMVGWDEKGKPLRLGLLTGHMPLQSVPNKITKPLLTRRSQLLSHSLVQDFGIPSPRIALLGLNPHAGEQGRLGTEEQQLLIPFVASTAGNTNLKGPWAADGFFAYRHYHQYDAVLACYHDQGLIPFKVLCGRHAVNYTAGLPMVRTSPAHGTARELAHNLAHNLGDATADHRPMRMALLLAALLSLQRKYKKNDSATPPQANCELRLVEKVIEKQVGAS